MTAKIEIVTEELRKRFARRDFWSVETRDLAIEFESLERISKREPAK